MSSPVIDLPVVGVRIGDTPILRGLDLQVRAGEAVGLHGANGSGKTTLLRVLATLLAPTGGTARVLGADRPLLERIGPGMYWVVVLLFGILVALRRSRAETTAQRDLVGLLGLDPVARFAGQGIANLALLGLFAVVLGPVAIALYDPAPSGWGWLLLIVALVVAGLALLGTLAGWLTASLTTGPALVPLLVAPLAVPLLLSATQALEGLRLRESILGWILLLVAVDLALAVVGVLGARPLEEAAR